MTTERLNELATVVAGGVVFGLVELALIALATLATWMVPW